MNAAGEGASGRIRVVAGLVAFVATLALLTGLVLLLENVLDLSPWVTFAVAAGLGVVAWVAGNGRAPTASTVLAWEAASTVLLLGALFSLARATGLSETVVIWSALVVLLGARWWYARRGRRPDTA